MSKKQTSETLELVLLLAFSGGFMDAYSYVCRGKVFANAQTGNMIMFGISIAESKFQDALRYGIPVLAFTIGIFISDIVRHKISESKLESENILHWRQVSVFIEIIIFLIVSVMPKNLDYFANILISTACGIQVESFRKIHGKGVATTMCMGNLRTATENFYGYIKSGSKDYLKRAIRYYLVIILFVIGAVVGNYFVEIFLEKSILFCVLILAIVFIIMFIEKKESIFDFKL